MKIALIVIFNHKYEKNLDLLEKIYSCRFTDIYYLMPFYTGNNRKIIGVYENSYYFQGYISQGLNRFYKRDYDYYYFIADDLLLNPLINESNFNEFFCLTGKEAYISHLIQLHQTSFWQWTKEAYEYNIRRKGTEVISELPSVDDAIKKHQNHGLGFRPLKFSQVYKLKLNKPVNDRFNKFIPLNIWLKQFMKYMKQGRKFSLSYPVCGAYSDTFIVPANAIKDFCHFCGVFAATELYVELAIPTALVFACENIITEDDLEWKGKTIWNKTEADTFLNNYSSVDELQGNFPEKCLYIHPVKLSKWTK